METWRRKAGVPQGPRTKFRFPHHNSPCDSVCRLHEQVPQLLCSGNEDVVGHGVRAYPLQQVFVWADCLKLLPVRLAMDLLSSSSVLFFTSLERERERGRGQGRGRDREGTTEVQNYTTVALQK